MVQDRDRHQTLIARQSRVLLRNLINGLWEFMELLDLEEAEVDVVVDEMIEFVEHVRMDSGDEEAEKVSKAIV